MFKKNKDKEADFEDARAKWRAPADARVQVIVNDYGIDIVANRQGFSALASWFELNAHALRPGDKRARDVSDLSLGWTMLSNPWPLFTHFGRLPKMEDADHDIRGWLFEGDPAEFWEGELPTGDSRYSLTRQLRLYNKYDIQKIGCNINRIRRNLGTESSSGRNGDDYAYTFNLEDTTLIVSCDKRGRVTDMEYL